MCGSGAVTGMAVTILVIRLIQRVLLRGLNAFIVAAVGMIAYGVVVSHVGITQTHHGETMVLACALPYSLNKHEVNQLFNTTE